MDTASGTSAADFEADEEADDDWGCCSGSQFSFPACQQRRSK